MPEVKIRQRVWKHLVAAAEKHRQTPERLANQALSEFLGRMADEELLAQSGIAARRSPLRVKETEEAIRRFRRKN